MTDLERAIGLAVKAHVGQLDKAGGPYILHPLRVMLAVEGETERTAAVLHDVVEDSDLTLDDLRREGFTEEVVAIVDDLTKREGEEYEAYVARAGRNPASRRVKLADLADNLDLSRLPAPTARDHARIKRYEQAVSALRASVPAAGAEMHATVEAKPGSLSRRR